MSSKEKLKDVIEGFLKSKEPGVLALKGPWGIGKTHFWNNCISRKLVNAEFNDVITISLFGQSSIEDIESQLLAHFLGSELNEDVDDSGSIKRARKKFSNLLSRFEEYLPGSYGKLAKAAKIQYLSNKSNLVICLDDVERASKDFPIDELFGFVEKVREKQNSKVVLILNEEFLLEDREKKKIYELFREKVIDIEITFHQTPAETLLVANPDAREFIYFEQLQASLVALNICNIRLTKRCLSHIETILHEFEHARHFKLFAERIAQSVVLYVWIYHTFGSELLNLIGKKVILDDDISDGEMTPYETLIKRCREYGYHGAEPLDGVIADLILEGYLDSESLKVKSVSVEYGLREIEAREKLWSAWNIYSESFEPDEKVMLLEVLDVLNQHGEYIYPTQIDRVISLFRGLGSQAGCAQIIDLFLKKNLNNRQKFVTSDSSGIKFVEDEEFRTRLELEYRPEIELDLQTAFLMYREGGDLSKARLAINNASTEALMEALTSGKIPKVVATTASVLGDPEIKSERLTAVIVALGSDGEFGKVRARLLLGLEL